MSPVALVVVVAGSSTVAVGRSTAACEPAAVAAAVAVAVATPAVGAGHCS